MPGVQHADIAELGRGLRRVSAACPALAGLVAVVAGIQSVTDPVPEWWFIGPSAREQRSSPKETMTDGRILEGGRDRRDRDDPGV